MFKTPCGTALGAMAHQCKAVHGHCLAPQCNKLGGHARCLGCCCRPAWGQPGPKPNAHAPQETSGHCCKAVCMIWGFYHCGSARNPTRAGMLARASPEGCGTASTAQRPACVPVPVQTPSTAQSIRENGSTAQYGAQYSNQYRPVHMPHAVQYGPVQPVQHTLWGFRMFFGWGGNNASKAP